MSDLRPGQMPSTIKPEMVHDENTAAGDQTIEKNIEGFGAVHQPGCAYRVAENGSYTEEKESY